MRTVGDQDEGLPGGVRETEPHDDEMQMRHDQLVAGYMFVRFDGQEGYPEQPEGEYEHDGQGVVGVGEGLGQGGHVFLVVGEVAVLESSDDDEDVRVRVDEGDEAGAQHQNHQRRRVRDHVLPVQRADVRRVVECRPVEVGQQRRTAHHRRGDPRERHPALAPRFRLHRVIAQRLPDGDISVHADPHQRVRRHDPHDGLGVADQPTHEVSVHPFANQSRVNGQRHD